MTNDELEKAIEAYERMPRAVWDGHVPLYSDYNDCWYSSVEEATDALLPGQCLAELRLIIGEPQYFYPLATDSYTDQCADDCELPEEIIDAIDAFNEAIKGIIATYEPGQYALAISPTLSIAEEVQGHE